MTRNALQPAASPGTWLRQELGRFFEDFDAPTRRVFNFAACGEAPVPALELVDDGDSYSLSVELPGIDENDVDLSMANGILTVSGETKHDEDHKEEGYLISERRYGVFTRRVALPTDADQNEFKAKSKRGVLKIRIAKDKDAAPEARKIAIKSE